MTIKILFNNSCNICRAEVNHYKKHCNEELEWIDVSTNIEAQQISSKSFKELLRRMHVIKDGKLKSAGHMGKVVKGQFIKFLCEIQAKGLDELDKFTFDNYKWDGKNFIKTIT